MMSVPLYLQRHVVFVASAVSSAPAINASFVPWAVPDAGAGIVIVVGVPPASVNWKLMSKNMSGPTRKYRASDTVPTVKVDPPFAVAAAIE